MDQYVKDSPTLRSIGLANDFSSKAELTQNWNNQLSQRVSLVVLAEGTPGADLQPGKSYYMRVP